VLGIFAIYYLYPSRHWQVLILIIASFIFYAWNLPILLLLLLLSILINAFTSFKVANTSSKKMRLFWATLGVVLNLSILGLFKYGSLLTNLGLSLLNVSNPPASGAIAILLHLPLPIGISFYTFQGISLAVDVLRQQESGEEPISIHYHNPFQYLLDTSFFLSFFPQLVAGPIARAQYFYPQIRTKYFQEIRWDLVFRYLVIGYFLKMVVADNLKDYTFWISFPYYQAWGTSTNIVLLFGYSMQIFADFAGYSLIAIGIAAAFGYTLPQNFNFP
jgi:alginate O-acetyltransferase complex protein AlgI